MNNRERQLLEERTVFAEFVKVCPLPLFPETARPGADPPDVLCDLESGETLAFELVSCEDEVKEDQAWTRRVSDEVKLDRALKDAYDKALSEGRIQQPDTLKCHTVHVAFKDDALLFQRERAVPRVIELLNDHGPGQHSINENPIRSIVCRPWDERHGTYTGPMFSTGSACYVGNCTISRIKAKCDDSREYESDHKIHLLAWSTTACHAESEMWRDWLANLLKSNGMGHFERIWVFGWHEKSIVFDSAASSAG